MDKILEINDVRKFFGRKEILRGINFSVEEGEIISVLGPSGCGKSTLLNIIAGILPLDGGTVAIHGQQVSAAGKMVAIQDRSINMVFQDFALWPHMKARENILYGLKVKKLGKEEMESRLNEVVSLLHLEGLLEQYPSELSGGQQQRVALARAMATGPKILLLDEPLSNLDAGLRVQLREELKELQKKLGITMVFVTHDQEEALSLSDKIVVMEKGVAVQTGTPREIYFSPVSRYVASFVGKANYIEENGRVQIVRPEDVWMEMDPSGDYTVRSASFMGAHTLYELENGSNVIKADLFGREGSLFSVGDRVRAGWGSRKDGPRDCHL